MTTTPYRKTVVLRPGQSIERDAATDLRKAEATGVYGAAANLVRDLVCGGQIFAYLGHGILGTLISQASSGMFDDLTEEEISERIIAQLRSTHWQKKPVRKTQDQTPEVNPEPRRETGQVVTSSKQPEPVKASSEPDEIFRVEPLAI